MANNAGEEFDRINRPRQESINNARRIAEAAQEVADLQRRNLHERQIESERQERAAKAATTAVLRAEIGRPLLISPALALVRKVGAECVAELRDRRIQTNFSIPNVYRSMHAIAPETVWKKNWLGKYAHVKTGELVRNLNLNAGRFVDEGRELRGWSITIGKNKNSGSSGTTSGGGWVSSSTELGGGHTDYGTTTGSSPGYNESYGAAITTGGRVIGWNKRHYNYGHQPSNDFTEIPIATDAHHWVQRLNFAKDLSPDSVSGWAERIHELGATIVFNAAHPNAQVPFRVR